MQLATVNAAIGVRDLRDRPVDLARFGRPRSELDDGIPYKGVVMTAQGANLGIMRSSIRPIDHDIAAFAKFIREPLADNPPYHTLTVSRRIEDRIVPGSSC